MTGDDLRNIFHRYVNFTSTLFAPFQDKELRRYKNYFDTVERQPLTAQQRRAVILNDKRNLVIAGAGTGKTSVIIAKAGYLVNSGRCKPEEILLLAFNNDAAKELSERCRERLGLDIRASTFHALGNQIISSTDSRPPSLSRLAHDPLAFSKFLNRVIEDLKTDNRAWKKLRTFIFAHLKPYKSDREFRSLAEYSAYMRNVELRALSGDVVKSFAELDIANFLFYNGVRFVYERQYPHGRNRYRPDFYLPDYKIWIEHFGIDRKGNTAPYIDRAQYNEGIKWKRSIHSQYRTTLLETYSWQKEDGLLTRALHSLLKERHVAYQPLSQDQIFQAFMKNGYVSQMAALLETFLSQFKASQISLYELDRRIRVLPKQDRAKAFKDLFVRFLERYQAELDRKNPRQIDFNDMISDATAHVREKRFRAPWKYIIVDEFQDISAARYLLLDSLLQARKDTRFFAVGDDWQSINRFAGSDMSIMRNFRFHFRGARILKLDHTFRFNSSIAEVSGAFIQKNPRQIRKKLSTSAQTNNPKVFLHHLNLKKERAAQLERLTSDIGQRAKDEAATLLVIARYNQQLPDQKALNRLKGLWPGRIKPPLSIHRSKGTEADYVIVGDLTADRFGFPTEIADDPLLNLVLADSDKYPHAEERRLLYVALTRAKHEVHLIVDRIQPSPFVLELMNDGYQVLCNYSGHHQVADINSSGSLRS